MGDIEIITKKLLNNKGEKICIYINKVISDKKTPVAILLHGFASRGKNRTNRPIVERLNKKGISTICVDLSGHGESEGSISETSVIKAEKEIEIVFNWVFNQEWVNTDKISILGNSFSGNALILFASKNKKIASIVLKSPVTDYYDVRLNQLGKSKMNEWQRNGSVMINNKIISNYSFIEDLNAIDTYKEISKIICPIYVIQGDKDEVIPISHTKRLKKVLNSNKDQIVIIKGADHGYSNEKHFNKMIEEIIKFIEKDLKDEEI